MPKDAIETIARGLIVHEHRVLLCKSLKHGYVYLPGGHIDPGELAAAALAREMIEEATASIEVGGLLHVHEHRFEQKGTARHEINLTFLARLLGNTEVRSAESHIDFVWMGLEELLDADLRPAAIRPWLCERVAGATPLALLHESHDNAQPRPAVFLDRDGTIIREVHYIGRPEQVELLPGAAEAIVRLRDAGLACCVVSNQSGVGRGMVSHADMWRTQGEVRRQLLAAGAVLDGVRFCCVAPPKDADGADDRRSRIDHPDRKPAPGMLLRLATELNLDLARSWMVGDMLSDVLAGMNAGCVGSIHVRTGHGIGPSGDEAAARATHAARDLGEAAAMIVQASGKSAAASR